MPGAEEEASALDAYYAATNEAKELVRRNLLDEGLAKWERALQDVGPYISDGRRNKLFNGDAHHFDRKRYDEEIGNDTYSNGSEEDDRGNDILEVDARSLNDNYQAEHRKLAKRHTMRSYTHTPRMINRSFTASDLERKGTSQIPRINFRNDVTPSHTPRGNRENIAAASEETKAREPTTSSERLPVSDPTLGPPIDESSFSGQLQGEDQRTGTGAQPHPSTAPPGSGGSKENDDWFGNLKSVAHNFVYGQKREYWPTRPVKVAILDSGFAVSGTARKAMKPYLGRIKEHKTFTTEFPTPKTPLENQRALDDLVGHGTTVAYQLMQTCPSADVYIAKVTVAETKDKQAVPDKGAVSRAIRYAATPVADGGWGVDVINMSFGWDTSELPGTAEAINGVSGAIEFAEKKGVLFFAAASNYGLAERNDVFYPARDHRVISVDAEDGLGNPARFALQSVDGERRLRYCAPGLSVGSPVSATPMCGSSFACPVAAGVAALVLEFARHESLSLSKSESVLSALSSVLGMRQVFKAMSRQATNHQGFRMLYPWHFLRDREREMVARDIIEWLKIEFGKVGHEIKYDLYWKATQTTTTDESVLQATLVKDDTEMDID